ncbi:MAG: TIGR02588 family protein [Acidimicrobiia bacterium]|nr:TIGR02588 family protein [Acidimicrobiia bacterium]
MRREPRTTPEWVTFAAACVVLLTLVGLIAGQLLGDREPATPRATVAGDAEPRGSRFQVPVMVVNDGDATAAAVSVVAELTIGAETLTAQQTIDFLAGGATEDLVFIFDADPASGELVVRVDGFTEP